MQRAAGQLNMQKMILLCLFWMQLRLRAVKSTYQCPLVDKLCNSDTF